MSELDFYNTVDKNTSAAFKDRGSKFLAFVFAVNTAEDCKACLTMVKSAHPKATHYCYAYRLGLEGNNFRVSDDGEPSGTAGRPILGQIDSKQITNTLIVVARYFGGTLLGVPGLINAYKSAASLALQVTPIVQKQVEVKYLLEFDYTQMNDIMRHIKHMGITVLEQEVQLFCRFKVAVAKNKSVLFLNKLENINGLTVTVQ
jgi:uncharacterized YigZ family protein